MADVGRDLFSEGFGDPSQYGAQIAKFGRNLFSDPVSTLKPYLPDPIGASQQMSKGMRDIQQGNTLQGLAQGFSGAMQLEGGGPQLGMISPDLKAARKAMLQEKIAQMPKQEPPISGQPIYEDVAKTDYRGSHTAPMKSDSSAPAHDLTGVYPDDIYTSNKAHIYYGHSGDLLDKQTIDIIRSLRNEPEKEITIYRSVPKGVTDINRGDWVTINKNYAKQHGESWVDNGKYDIISKKVKASDIYTDGNSIHEFGFDPQYGRNLFAGEK